MRQLKISKQVTNRETASLDKYLQEIGRVELITADEEVELAKRIHAGDQARDGAAAGAQRRWRVHDRGAPVPALLRPDPLPPRR